MEDIIRFKNLGGIPDLVHGFSTRKFGNMRSNNSGSDKSLRNFLQVMEVDPLNIIRMQQVHGNNVEWVNNKQTGWKLLNTDGIITGDQNTYLPVAAADCIPILIYDVKKKFLGAVHAGWKGIYNEILKEAISQFVSKGSSPGDMLVGIGPCIRSCCFNVDKKRAELFEKKFKNYTNFIIYKNNSWYLDLPILARQQLISAGIHEDNIEDLGLCTYDNSDKFFSYRKEGEKSGRFIGIIGRR